MVVQVRRPRAVVFDILGTASKSGFLERILFPFLKVNLDPFIRSHWDKPEFVRLYNKIMFQSIEFNKSEPSTPVVLAHDNNQAKQSLTTFIAFVTDNGINSPAVTQLRFRVWFEGYQQSKIKTPIYSDVPNRMRAWFAEGVKFFVFSNTWIEAQKALLKNTNHGDLTNLISGHFDNDFGLITETESWRRLSSEIRENPNDILFLTKSPVEGRAAADAGVSVVLVLTHRHNVKAVSHEDRQRFPYVRTLNDLAWSEGSMMPTTASQAAAGAAAAPPGASQSQPPVAVGPSTVTAATSASQSQAPASLSASRQRSTSNSRSRPRAAGASAAPSAKSQQSPTTTTGGSQPASSNVTERSANTASSAAASKQ